MKKSSGILLAIYLTIVAVVCAFLPSLLANLGIFGGVKPQTTEEFDARVLVNTVCYDLDIISKNTYEEAVGVKSVDTVSTQALDAKDYPSSNIDKAPTTKIEQTLNKALNATKKTKFLLDCRTEKGVYYFSKGNTAHSSEYQAIYYTLGESSITFHLIPYAVADGNKEEIVVFSSGETKDDWSLEYKARVVGSDNVSVEYVKFEGDEFGVYRVYTDSVNLLAATKNPTTNLTSAENIAVTTYDCNVKTHKKTLYEDGTTTPVLSNPDKLTVANRALSFTKDVTPSTNEKYKDVKYTELDFLANYYNYTK